MNKSRLVPPAIISIVLLTLLAIFSPSIPAEATGKFIQSAVVNDSVQASIEPKQQSQPLQEDTPLSVTSTQPSDGSTDVSTDSQIVIVFNRPVVNLVGLADQANLPNPLTVEPAVEGKGAWLNTSIYVFKPSLGLAGATDYTLTIADITAVNGETLAEPRTVKFSTKAPSIVSSEPAGTLIRPDAAVLVTFDQSMDRTSTEAAFSLEENADNTAVKGTVVWGELNRSLAFMPTESLQFGKEYTIKIAATAQPASGIGSLGNEYSSAFTVAPLPAVEYSSPNDGDKEVLPDATVTLRFNTNMSTTSVIDNIRLSPAITNTQVYSYYSDWNRELTISWLRVPQSNYTITIGSAAEDIFGNKLGEEYELSFTTGDFSPFIQLDTQHFVHYSAYTQTRTSLLYRNVDKVDVKLYGLPESELFKLTGENQYQIWDTYAVPNEAGNLIWQRSYTPGSERNVAIRQIITLTNKAGNNLPPGLYLIESSEPTNVPTPQDGTVQNQKSHSVIVLSNYQLLVKKADQGQSLAWLTDLRSGLPVAGKVIRFVSNGQAVGEATTDENGIATLALSLNSNFSYLPVLAISGEQGSDDYALASSDWNSGIASWDFNLPGGYYTDRYTMYFYSDRPIYRPGQTIYWKGIIREMQNDQYSIPDANTEIKIKINDGFGNQVSEQILKPNEYGTVNGEFVLSADAVTGFYNLEASIQYGKDRTSYGSAGFQVAAYRKPEFAISMTPDKPEYNQGDTVKVTVQASYFSGGPLVNAPVTWQLIANPYFFSWTNPPKALEGRWFSFDPFDPKQAEYDPYRGFSGGLLKEGSGKTDSAGNFVIELPADLGDALQSQQWSINATIQSSTNQFVNEGTSVIVHRGAFYIGISPQSYVGQRDESSTIDLVTIDPEGKAVADVTIDATVYEFNWNSVYERTADGSYMWNSSVERTPIFSTTVTSDGDGLAHFDWTPAKGGQYQIVAQATDSQENAISSAGYQWISESDPSRFVAWQRRNNDRIDLIADKKSYKPGDTAKVLVTSPYTGTIKALMTIERGGVIESKVLDLTGNSNTLEIPITEAHIPNIYVSVVLVKGIDEVNSLPSMSVGYAQLTVDNSSKALNIAVETSASVVKPGDTVTYTLAVSDDAGNPAPDSAVSVALVDKAVLALAQGDTRKLLDIFYYQRQLGVVTGATLVINNDRMSQQLSEGAKGGGGGGGSGLEIRQDFPDIAYWRAELVTDKAGKIVFSVKLPDNLTTWALAVKAINKETQVGEAVNEIVATKPLQIRPLLPRFFTAGDQARIGAALLNTSKEATGKLDFEIAVSGATLDTNEITQTLELSPGAQSSLDFPITVDALATSVVVTMSAAPQSATDNAHLSDAIVLTIPVNRYTTPETVASAGTVSVTGQTESIVLPAEATGDAALQVNLEPSLAAGMLDGLDYLEHYPYECNEQTVSRFLPNLFTVRALRSLSIDDKALESKLNVQLGVGVNRLLSRQNPDGGWGYWPGNESQPFITAYVLWGLAQAKTLDYAVDQLPLDRAAEFLDRNFEAPVNVKDNWKLNEMAFTHYVLAEMGKGDTGRASTLFDERARMSHYGKAYLAMALVDYGSSEGSFDSQVQTLVDDLIGSATLTASTASWHENEVDYWTMNTDTRSTAIVLAALTRLRPDNPLLPNAVRWLMDARKAGRWANTQENAWSIIALTDWLAASGELNANYDWKVELNGEELGSGSFGADNLREEVQLRADVSKLLKDTANELHFSRSNDSGQLYYTTSLRYTIDALAVDAKDHGLVVDRRFEAVDKDGTSKMVNSAQVGDIISVTVTIIAPRDLVHVLIEAPIPAGTEPIDPRLESAAYSLNENGQPVLRPVNSTGDQPWFYWSPSYLDVRDDKVAMFATLLPAGTYEYTFKVRATVPGEYRVLPAYGEMMYFNDVWGRSAGAQFTVSGE